MKSIAYSTTSSNLRNWCLTRALELEGAIDLSRFREHRFSYQPADSGSAEQTMNLLRVLLVPERAEGYEARVSLFLDGKKVAGLIIRNQVAVPMVLGGRDLEKDPELKLEISKDNWAKLISGKIHLSKLIRERKVQCTPDDGSILKFFSCFDHPSLAHQKRNLAMSNIPKPSKPFKGQIGRLFSDSKPEPLRSDKTSGTRRTFCSSCLMTWVLVPAALLVGLFPPPG